MRIIIGSDHRGYELKELLKKELIEKGLAVEDCGTYNGERVDYPDIAIAACDRITAGEFDFGILICGTGTGMCMTANKHKGIRASLCGDPVTGHYAGEHDNANVICLAGDIIGPSLASAIVDAYLNAEFAGGRHQTRLDKVMALENR